MAARRRFAAALHCVALLVVLFAAACTRTIDVYLGTDDPPDRPAESGSAQPPAPPAPPQPSASGGSAAGGSGGGVQATSDAAVAVRDASTRPDAASDASVPVDAGGDPPAGCAPGTADCDGDASNGCETDTASDLQNCGGCDRLCHTEGHDAIEASCVAGRCELTCRQDPFGDHDCDGDPDNGCETRLLTDNQNCGACGVRCICRNGNCL